jgi:hypothetical protein
LVQKSLEPAEEIIQKVAEIMEMHVQSHREETAHDCQKFQARLDRYHAELMAYTHSYVDFKKIFINEVKLTFPDCDKNFPIIGVRDGRILVGRYDNRRGDINNIDNLLLGAAGMHTIELELSIQKVDSEVPESHTRN